MAKYLVVCCLHLDILPLVDLSFSVISLRYDLPSLISDILLHNGQSMENVKHVHGVGTTATDAVIHGVSAQVLSSLPASLSATMKKDPLISDSLTRRVPHSHYPHPPLRTQHISQWDLTSLSLRTTSRSRRSRSRIYRVWIGRSNVRVVL